MARYFLELAYQGTDFVGWQRQPKGRSVQGTLEQALETLLRRPVPVVGSGRTDAGVHALGQVAHIEQELTEQQREELLYRLNALLPDDIACHALRPVQEDAHARFSAEWRSYVYYATLTKNPFTKAICARLPYRVLDLEAMNEACGYLLGEHTMRAFAKNVPEETHYLCHVHEAQWTQLSAGMAHSEEVLAFRIRANRFLRGQVRAIVGALLEVGRGRQKPEWIQEVLLEQRDQLSAAVAPAEGLYLEKVHYPASVYRI